MLHKKKSSLVDEPYSDLRLEGKKKRKIRNAYIKY